MTPKTLYWILSDAVASGTLDDPAYIGYAHFDESKGIDDNLVNRNGISHLLSGMTCYDGVLQLLFVVAGRPNLPIDIKAEPLPVTKAIEKLDRLLPELNQNDEIETNLGSIGISGYEITNINLTDYIVLYDS